MTQLPATLVEAEAVETIAHWIDRVAAALTTETARQVLRKEIRERLREGTIPTMQVIAAARAGHQDADAALRQLAAEHLSRREEMPTELAAYAQEALLVPPATYPPGRNAADTWLRDIAVAFLVVLVTERWPAVPITRSHTSRNTGRLSACYLVSVALGQRGHNLSERRVEKIYGTRHKIAARLSASIPAI